MITALFETFPSLQTLVEHLHQKEYPDTPFEKGQMRRVYRLTGFWLDTAMDPSADPLDDELDAETHYLVDRVVDEIITCVTFWIPSYNWLHVVPQRADGTALVFVSSPPKPPTRSNTNDFYLRCRRRAKVLV